MKIQKGLQIGQIIIVVLIFIFLIQQMINGVPFSTNSQTLYVLFGFQYVLLMSNMIYGLRQKSNVEKKDFKSFLLLLVTIPVAIALLVFVFSNVFGS